jgi:hypothetical protein
MNCSVLFAAGRLDLMRIVKLYQGRGWRVLVVADKMARLGKGGKSITITL